MRFVNYKKVKKKFSDGSSDCFTTDPDPTMPTTTTVAPGPTTTRDPNQPQPCQPNEVTFHPFPSDCSYYTLCACGAQVLLQCAPSLYFDVTINNCNFMQLVHCQDGVRP